jgi:hypothetical protein
MHGNEAENTPTHGDTDRLLNSKEIRALLGGISESKFRRMTRDGEIPLVRQGSYVYARASDIAKYIASLPAA